MKIGKSFKLSALAVALSALPAASAFATNGYFLTGSGYRAQGMGGVGIAYGRDSLSIGANPANVVNTGMRGDMGFGVFNAEVSAATGLAAGVLGSNGAPSSTDYGFDRASSSDGKYFLVPEMGMTMNLSERLSFGMAFLGGGLATAYPLNLYAYPTFYNPSQANSAAPPDSKIGVELYQLQMPLTIGYKLNDQHSVGVALNLALQRFRAYGLETFQYFDFAPIAAISADLANLTGRGMDYSYGAGVKFGWQGNFLEDRVTLGAAYTSRTYMTKLDKYRGLFAEQGDFDIPENFGVGIALKPTKNLVISADITRIKYSDVASVANRGPGVAIIAIGPNAGKDVINSGQYVSNSNQVSGIPSNVDNAKETGNDQGMGFGWGDQTVYKLGVQYGVNKRLQVRAGYNYGKSPVSDDQMTFNVLAPGIVESHYSLGFTYKHSEELEITGTYVYAEPASQTSPPYQNVVGAATANMHQNLFALSLGWVLDPGLRDYGDEAVDPYIDFSDIYIGFAGGQSSARSWGGRDFAQAFAAAGFASTTTATDTMSSSFKGYVGYQISKRIGVEGGFVDLNDARASTSVNGGAPAGDPNVYSVLDHDAFFAALVGRQPLFGGLSGIAKVGLSSWTSTLRVRDTSTKEKPANVLPGSGVLVNGVERGWGAYYGLGLAYALTENIDTRMEWERFAMDGVQGVGGDVDLYSMGVSARF